jgi:uncharacterized protein (DUF697 family)
MNKLEDIIPEFIKGGWIVTLIGASGMVARLVVSEEENNLQSVIKNIVAAMIASTIAWFILEQFEINSMIKAITYGLVGLNSPELLKGITKIAQSFSNNPEAFISNAKKGKITSTKKPIVKRNTTKKR